MQRRRLVLLLAGPAILGLVALACEDSQTAPDADNPDGSLALDGARSDSGTQVAVDGSQPDATNHTDSGSDAGNCRTAITSWNGGPMLVPSPYRETADSPFACRTFASYFHLANFEGDSGLPPGTTAAFGSKYPGTGASDPLTDSVDGDDGVPDGAPPGFSIPCPACQSWFSGSGVVDFSFDETALGGLPTHAGMVWTDDGVDASVTFTAYGPDGGVVASQIVPNIGTGGIQGQTDEDRFFGVVAPAGVKRVTMSHTGGGIEIDHLQIGR